MAKIPFEDLLKTTCMFFLNPEIDEKFIAKRNDFSKLEIEMKDIDNRTGLENYIREYKNSIDNLLIILGISTEYFKRITSLFRLRKGFRFRTEWSTNQFRNFIKSDEQMMEWTLNLFLNGPDDEELTKYIPKYRLESFKITPAVKSRLSNPDVLKLLFAKDLDTPFNNGVTYAVSKNVEDKLRNICKIHGYQLNKKFTVDTKGDGTSKIPVAYVIMKPGASLPLYYINCAFHLTTSNGQTKLSNQVKSIRDYIINNNPNAIQISIIDGAGWVGRQADYQDIWDYSNVCLNLAHLENLNTTIE